MSWSVDDLSDAYRTFETLIVCGIAGILNPAGLAVAPELLERMIGSIRNRGPDATGVHSDPAAGIGLAHARLSIIDLTTGGQPMSNHDGTLWITFNGEIFNYVELRADLMRSGRRFATESDTEVILQMYEEKGEDCVSYFNGDWAFAIWDGRTRKLFLSRDRVGVRPLFYAQAAGAFVFASEVKAVLHHPDIQTSIDLEALDQVFTFWCPLQEKTLFTGVKELPPGHSMRVQDGRTQIWSYWQLAFDPRRITEEEAAERLLDLLSDATRIRLRSDVPVGAYLSGGIDSSITTALAKRYSGSRLQTFSVTFDDPEFDESRFQQDVVDLNATEHHALRCTYDEICTVFPEVVRHAEKPILRTAPAPLFLLSRLVRDMGFKVVLTGEGADEFLGGYDIFKEAKIRRFWAGQITSRWRPLLLKRLYPYMQNLQAQSEAYRRHFFHVDPSELSSPFFSHLPRWDLTARSKMFLSDDVRSQLCRYDTYGAAEETLPAEFAGWQGWSQAQFLEAVILLPGYILSSQGDRMSMAHSVEGRFPFLDHRVIEFAGNLPARLKMKTLNEKYILKRAAGHLVPASIRARPKQPYRAPDARSFFDSETKKARNAYVDEILSVERLREFGLFNPTAVQKLVDKARRGQVEGAKDNMALVGILSTQLLVEQFLSHSERLN